MFLPVGDEHDINKQVKQCACSLKSTLFPGLLSNHFRRLQVIKNWMVGRPWNEATVSCHHPWLPGQSLKYDTSCFCMGEACEH